MPTRPPRACPRCGRAGTGRCDCTGAWASSNPVAQRRNGSTRRSRRDRARMLAANPMCANNCGRLARIDDHIVPVADGGDLHDPGNHQGLCGPCHDEKTAGESARRRCAGPRG